MISFAKDVFGLFVRHRRLLTTILVAVLLLIVVIGGVSTYKMRSAQFCTNCHYMEPYVRHWQTSGHKDVTCIQCHDYGVGRLAVNAIKYWSTSYNPRPKANVHDASCLASDCHEVRLLSGKTQYRKNITFDHAVHLENPLRGEKLRCTSCHNQIVQYNEEVSAEHMAVNDMSCFVCHFKDAGQGEAITGCDACHGMPKTKVEHGGFTFDHEPYMKMKVECKQCHTRIVKGDGAVPESKCYSCHVERLREEFSREQLHSIHVTTNGIDCFRCHSEIEHGNFEMVSSLEIQCENCHVRQHNGPKQLYMGIGGTDTLDIPSVHFVAQVSCVGCHTHLTSQGEPLAHQAKKEAQRASCIACHGPGRELMFDNWIDGTAKVVADYRKYLAAAKATAGKLGGSKTQSTLLQRAISTAETGFAFIEESHMSHNISYSLYLLNSNAERIAVAMTSIQPGVKTPQVGASILPENSCLTFCHSKTLFPEEVSYKGKKLPHAMHAIESELGCKSCHSISEHGKTQIDKSACADCHEDT
ncbi:MAG: cytochrome c3 family protein [Candidatus Zixiibacteriota bacterium]